jgi:hypothetical protein
MWKLLTVGSTALAITVTSLAYAQQGDRPGSGRRWQPSIEDLRAFGEARLAALKAGLMLTSDQAQNWPAYEQAERELAKQRLERRMALRNASPSNDPVERLRRQASAMSDTGASLTKLADATEPLYKSLDENQKQRFALLNRLTRPGYGQFHRSEGRNGQFGEQRL